MAEPKTAPKPEEVAEATPNLYAKLREAQAAVARVGKEGTNTHQHYDYTKADDVIAAASKAVTDAGLVAWSEGEGEQSGLPYSLEIVEGRTSGGGPKLTVTARGRLVILDPDSGERQHFPLIGTGTDSPGDKAIYKAITGGVKYAWQAALQIAFGDDPEDSSSEGAQAAAKEAPASGPPFGPPSEDLARVKRSIQFLIGAGVLDESIQNSSERIFDAIVKDAGGYLPTVSAKALLRVAAEVKTRVEQGQGPDLTPGPDGEPEPAGDPDPDPDPDGESLPEVNSEPPEGVTEEEWVEPDGTEPPVDEIPPEERAELERQAEEEAARDSKVEGDPGE